ncbi:hypothetical protein JCM4814A_15120 [Streptomyces phaeofaciens JCM 4814]|uniref:Uncharacterized protein n=1 Tax=Streptomyces phaeofaciens TaxID=68254 RepID=A0A918LZ85_9ACTN|nr:hypothetical protein GCM10010226_62030 [Streptomyces phaeofaciens]
MKYAVHTLAHLLIGLPAAVALLCARWYVAHGHCGTEDLRLPGLDNCTYDQIEDSGFVLIGLILFGVVSGLLLLLYDYLRPRLAERPLMPRLLTLPAVLLPYAVYVANAG